MSVTQDQFSVMSGHVYDGNTVTMNNGDKLRLVNTMRGWAIQKDGKTIGEFGAAWEVERFIVTYGAAEWVIVPSP